ncbi:MAG: hypothetical protein EOM48_12800, partial [Bacilli bacterium]|nr:hypothetical protein [Bacilli bacterium]
MHKVKILIVSALLLLVCMFLTAAVDKSTFLASLNESEKDFIASHPVVSVLFDPAWAPLEYLDSDNNPVGMSKQYLDEISTITGLSFELDV